MGEGQRKRVLLWGPPKYEGHGRESPEKATGMIRGLKNLSHEERI